MIKETFDWLENISQQDWEGLENQRILTINGIGTKSDLDTYKPPFDIKILEIQGVIAIVRFSIGNFDFTKNIAMIMGDYYQFGPWGILMQNIDEKNKECIIKIRHPCEK